MADAQLRLTPTRRQVLAAGAVAATVSALGVRPAEASSIRDTFNVRDFGAVGDGAHDDTAAIQAALDAAAAAGGGVVVVPAGAYILSIRPITPGGNPGCLALRPRVVLQGEGRDASVLRLAAGQPDYEAICFPADPPGEVNAPGTPLDDVAFYDLTFDQNGSQNPIASAADISTGDGLHSRFVIGILSGSRIRVERCRFTDIGDTINTLFVSGNGAIAADTTPHITDVVIRDNVFDGIGLATDPGLDHDHSTIYTVADTVLIENNTIAGRTPGLPGAVAAIEVHGPRHRVVGNTVIDVAAGLNIAGAQSFTAVQLEVSHNMLRGVAYGMNILAENYSGAQLPALRDLDIHHNTIVIDRDQWVNRSSVYATTSAVSGIQLVLTVQSFPCRGVRIRHNQVRFLPSSLPTTASDGTSAGVFWNRQAYQAYDDDDIQVTDNIIENAIGVGIWWSAPARRLTIARNLVVDPAAGAPGIGPSYAAGLWVTSQQGLEDVRLNDNIVVDTRTPGVLSTPLYVAGPPGSAAYVDCEALDNHVAIADASRPVTPIIGTDNPAQAYRFRGCVAANAHTQPLPSGFFAFGSTWSVQGDPADPSSAVTYIQSVGPAYFQWSPLTAGSQPAANVPELGSAPLAAIAAVVGGAVGARRGGRPAPSSPPASAAAAARR